MKLIIFPLSCLIVLSLLSMAGLGNTLDDTFYLNAHNNPDGTPKYLYDSGGNPVCDYNFTAYEGTADGYLVYVEGGATASWYNGTNPPYPLFYDTEATTTVPWQDVQNPVGLGVNPAGIGGEQTFSIAGSLGFIALVVVIMAVGTLAGLTFFGSGLSEISVDVLFKGTAYITIWGVFSYLSYALLFGTGEFLLFIFYFVITVVYTLGVVNSVGSPQQD